MKIFGISESFHDASLTVIEDDEILFAAHAERYSKVKNDTLLNIDIINEAMSYGSPDIIAYYEKPFLKKTRLALAGGIKDKQPFYKNTSLSKIKSVNIKHHKSHAAAGYYTSNFRDAAVVVIDAIGEWETTSVWIGEDNKLTQIYTRTYPFSFGLFYSAFTQLVGLKPNEEEYIFMGMAAYGDKSRYYEKINKYFDSINNQKYNFHLGILDWEEIIDDQSKFDIAAATQYVYEQRLVELMSMVRNKTGKKNLVFMGGCALNCSANTLLWDIFDDIWIMPNPGDAGSSLGAAASVYGKHLNWKTPYLGSNIDSNFNIDNIISRILSEGVCPVATGRAEFGPRSLGNRSILADPRDPNIKDKVNMIKKRELFRPFAPVIMEEYADQWFDMNYKSPYMQYTPRCLKPDLIPSVVHHDGTSRVQTVNHNDNPNLYSLLEKWNKVSGVPILLNTSLNIKGQPIINDYKDVVSWQDFYGINIEM